MNIITLGVGPGSEIEFLVLTGLGESNAPPPAPTESAAITLGRIITLTEDIIYVLPPQVVNVTVITSAGTIEVSLDAITWQEMTLDNNKNFTTSAVFIRSVDGDSDVIAKAF